LFIQPKIEISEMKSIRIIDLAEVMIKELASRYGYSPRDIEIRVTGTKLGEKLYEELVTEHESSRVLENKGMIIILPKRKELSHINKSYSQSSSNIKT